MFDPPPKESGFPRWLLKLLAFSACGLGIGFGFCGLDAHLYPHAEFGGSALAGIGFCLVGLSIVGFAIVVLVLLVWLVTLMFPG